MTMVHTHLSYIIYQALIPTNAMLVTYPKAMSGNQQQAFLKETMAVISLAFKHIPCN